MRLSFRNPYLYLLALPALTFVAAAWLWVGDSRPEAALLVNSQAPERSAAPYSVDPAYARAEFAPEAATAQETPTAGQTSISLPRSNSTAAAAAPQQLSGSVHGEPGSGISTPPPNGSRGMMRAGAMSEEALRAWESERTAGVSSSSAPSDSAAASLPGGSSAAAAPATAPQIVEARMPIVAQEPAPGQNFNEQQTAKLDELRQQFTEAVGGVNQDPSDPAYLKRWERARAEFDRQYQVTFGQQAFLLQQYQANVTK